MPTLPNANAQTILVVDDDPMVLQVVVSILEMAAFHVLAADSGHAALKVARETERKIDLLLSDIDMKELSGPDLGLELKETRPGLRVMLMSGGTNGNLMVLNYGWAYILKLQLSAG